MGANHARVIGVTIAILTMNVLAVGRQPQVRPIEGGELFRDRIPFERIQPTAEQRQRWAAAPQQAFGPFDTAQVGFHAATVLVDRQAFDCDTTFDEQRAVARIVIARERTDGADYWMLSGGATVDPSDCNADDLRNWSVMEDDEQPEIALAAGEGVPVFTVAYDPERPDVRSTDYATHRLVIDARPPTPVLIARLSTLSIDAYCVFADVRPTTSCSWSGAQKDFVCSESYAGGRRHSWLVGGARLPRLPGADGLRSLSDFRTAVGTWSTSDDVGAVRLIADLPAARSGQRLRLFGSSNESVAVFHIHVQDGNRSRVIPVSMHSAEPEPSSTSDPAGDPPLPQISVADFPPAGEPPLFRAHTLVAGPVRLLRVVMEQPSYTMRTVFHLAIEETAQGVVAQAIRLGWSGTGEPGSEPEYDLSEPVDACDPTFGGFAAPTGIRQAPLRIDYEVEPPFLTGMPDERRPEECVTGSHATWQGGRGFVIDFDRARCSQIRFRTVHVAPDGVMTPRILRTPQ